MNKFDEQQINLLKPLLTHGVVLHFPFCANTFSIAYHYNVLVNKTEGPQDLIRFHDWNNPYPPALGFDVPNAGPMPNQTAQGSAAETQELDEVEPKRINLFYALDLKTEHVGFQKPTPLSLIREKAKSSKEKKSLREVRFSSYCRRFVFLNNNLYTRSITAFKTEKTPSLDIDQVGFSDFSTIQTQYPDLERVLAKAIKDGIVNINVYTDIENEARAVLGRYCLAEDIHVNYFDKYCLASLRLLDEDRNESKTVELYFYDAATSFRFLTDPGDFIPVLLNPDKFPPEGINTVAIIHYTTGNEEAVSAIEQALTSYHTNLFNEVVRSGGAESLNGVRLAYNKYARLIRHDSYFYTPQSFANCIALHHEYANANYGKNMPVSETASEVDKPVRNNIHIHYGAGKLGIGLVLPILNTETTRLIVVQKASADWRRKINLAAERITLESNTFWADTFTLNQPGDRSFFLIESLSEMSELVAQATSISYSLNSQDAEKQFLMFIATQVDFREEKVLLFPFENNPFVKDRETSREKILAQNIKLRDVQVKADRICHERQIRFDNTVNVSCENHVEVILNIAEAHTNHLFSTAYNRNTQLIFADSDARFKILAKRKQFLVNELHFIMSVYGYDFLLSRGITHWENQFITIIQSAIASDSKYATPIETFIRLQIVRLLHIDKDHNFLKREYNLQEPNYEMIYEYLMTYANRVKIRFSNSKEDQISRIFNTVDINTVERKYNAIIIEIINFVSEQKNFIESLPMGVAGTSLEYEKLIEDIKTRLRIVFTKSENNFNEFIQQKEKEKNELIDQIEKEKK